MHIAIVSHGEEKGRIPFERKAKEAILTEGFNIGFLHKPKHENDVTDLVKKKKSAVLLLSECSQAFAEKIVKAVNRKFNKNGPMILILGGKVAGATTISTLSEVGTNMLQTA